MVQEKIDIVAVNTFVSVLVIDYKLKYKFNGSCCFTEEKSKLLINYPSSFFLLKCARNISLVIGLLLLLMMMMVSIQHNLIGLECLTTAPTTGQGLPL